MTAQVETARPGPAENSRRTIDAHQHFWRIDRGDYGWLTPAHGPVYRDFLPDDLSPIAARRGIDATILVQAAPTAAETRFLLDLARDTPLVAGVVGWAPFDAPDASDRIASLAIDARLVGLRPMVQDEPDDDWLADSRLRPAFDAVIAHRLVFDALLLPRHLPRLARVLDRHPDLQVVVDHGAKPRIRDGALASWRADMAIVAAHRNVACKLSGLVTEAPAHAGLSTLQPYIDTLLDLFGPRRLIWGSDWPVVELAGGYDRWHALAQQALRALDDDERAAVFGGTARRVYLGGRTGLGGIASENNALS